MKNKILALCIFASLFPSYAHTMEGTWLKNVCASDDERNDFACMAFILGAVHGLALGGENGLLLAKPDFPEEDRGPGLGYFAISVCTKPDVTPMQLRKVVKNFLDTNPTRAKEPAANLILDALREEFPSKDCY